MFKLISPSLILSIVFGITAVVGAYTYVGALKDQLTRKNSEIAELNFKLKRSQHDLVSATADKQIIIEMLAKSAKERQVIQSNLSATIQRLQSQKPPTECKEAIEWAVENKNDLAW